MEIREDLRESVRKSLPELSEIKDEELRNLVVDAWAYCLGQSTFQSIDEIRPSGNPDTPTLKGGTQTDHIRGVTRLALALADTLKEQFPQLPIDRDLLTACALCHDVGKPYEFDPPRQKRWSSRPAASGWPPIRHPQYGTHVCLTVGLARGGLPCRRLPLGRGRAGPPVSTRDHRPPCRLRLLASTGGGRPAGVGLRAAVGHSAGQTRHDGAIEFGGDR